MTGSKDLTRRDAIKAGAAATVTTAVALPALAAGAPADPVVALDKQLLEAIAKCEKSEAAFERAHSAAKAAYPPVPAELIGHDFIGSLGWLQEMSRNGCSYLIPAGKAHSAAIDEIYAQHGAAALDEVCNADGDRCWAVIKQMAKTPATSLQGAAVKLRIVVGAGRGVDLEEASCDGQLIRDALAVVERRARGAVS